MTVLGVLNRYGLVMWYLTISGYIYYTRILQIPNEAKRQPKNYWFEIIEFLSHSLMFYPWSAIYFKLTEVKWTEFYCRVMKFLDCKDWLCSTNSIIILTWPMADYIHCQERKVNFLECFQQIFWHGSWIINRILSLTSGTPIQNASK